MLNGSASKDNIKFELLNGKLHDRKNFDCGNESLNRFITQYATQQQRNNVTVIHVATSRESAIPKPIYGFYTLSASNISFDSLPKNMIRNIPHGYKIPSAKIGRLARNLTSTSSGFGTKLLINAFGLIDRLSNEVGIALIDIDAKNDRLSTYYKKFGFTELLGYPNSLVIPTSTICQILASVLEEAERHEHV